MNKVVHFEIPADDMKRAKKFYKDIFGWEMMDIPGYAMEYTIVRTVPVDENNMPKESGAINGGLMKRAVKGETPVLVIDVPDVDASVKKVLAAGGKLVMPKMKVMDMGLYARVTDSEGNIIGVWENIKK